MRAARELFWERSTEAAALFEKAKQRNAQIDDWFINYWAGQFITYERCFGDTKAQSMVLNFLDHLRKYEFTAGARSLLGIYSTNQAIANYENEHYQKSLKGLALILGIDKSVDKLEALKLVRYLIKKVNGHVFFVPFNNAKNSHDVQELAQIAKEFNVKAKACTCMKEAFDAAKGFVDERDGLVCIAGSNELVSQYWNNRGIKKF